MNIKQMRVIDTYIGGLVCFFLEIYEKGRRLFYSNKSHITDNPGKILVTKYLGIGSILLATPMLRGLRSAFPKSRIVFLTFDKNAEFAKQIGLIDEVLPIRISSFLSFTKDLLSVLYRVRQSKFDVVFDLEFFARFSTIVSYLSGAKVRMGYYLPKLWRGNLLTNHIHFNPYRHATEIFSAQLVPFNIKVTDFSLVSPIIKEHKMAKVRLLLKGNGYKDKEDIVAVNINASDLSRERRWPMENFVKLINYVVEYKKNIRVVLIGSREEAGYVDKAIMSLSQGSKDRLINLCGRLDIEECITVLKQSSLFISNDSGPLHIASALGVSTVSFFGPESPSLYGPIGNKNKVFYMGIYCSPCLNVYNAKTAMCKGNNRCMKGIEPSKVIEVLLKEGIL